MRSSLKWDRLGPTDFEALCYDLLRELGAKRLQWRRGTSLDASPADQGRDIECEFSYATPSGQDLVEHCFVECKHYLKGVPAKALSGALAWAEAERPDALYFLISGFLSNAAKQHLDAYRANNRPRFRIVVWERPDIEARLEGRANLITKYKLSDHLLEMDLLHSAHVEFMTRGPLLVSLDTFFGIVDRLTPEERRDFLVDAFELVLQPRYRKPDSPDETIAELRLDPVTYSGFKTRCHEVRLPGFFLVHAIVSFALHMQFNSGNYTRAEEVRDTLRRFLAFIEAEDGGAKDKADKERQRQMIEKIRSDIIGVESRLRQSHRRYLVFCDRILRPLLEVREPFADV